MKKVASVTLRHAPLRDITCLLLFGCGSPALGASAFTCGSFFFECRVNLATCQDKKTASTPKEKGSKPFVFDFCLVHQSAVMRGGDCLIDPVQHYFFTILSNSISKMSREFGPIAGERRRSP